MARWLPQVLARIRELAARRRVRFTQKALHELASLDLEIDEEDACDILASLRSQDSAGRQASETTGEWMYVFKPNCGGILLYVKVILRDDCILISVHEDHHDDYS